MTEQNITNELVIEKDELITLILTLFPEGKLENKEKVSNFFENIENIIEQLRYAIQNGIEIKLLPEKASEYIKVLEDIYMNINSFRVDFIEKIEQILIEKEKEGEKIKKIKVKLKT